MDAAISRLPTDDFDVGDKGISGHYDQMLGEFRENSYEVLQLLFAWGCVLTWPPDSVFFRIGPVLTLAWVIRLALIAWTIKLAIPVIVGLYYRSQWLALERQGIYYALRNDHVQRIVFYRKEDDFTRYENATQRGRLEANLGTEKRAKTQFYLILRGLLRIVGLWLLLPAAILIVPILIGPEPIKAVREAIPPLQFFTMIDFLREQEAPVEVLHWLLRPDVHGVLASASIPFFLACYFLHTTVPTCCQLGWHLFDARTRKKGCQYIPAPRVLEPVLSELDLARLREELVHGKVMWSERDKAVSRMGG